jgi:hypothetical protein
LIRLTTAIHDSFKLNNRNTVSVLFKRRTPQAAACLEIDIHQHLALPATAQRSHDAADSS